MLRCLKTNEVEFLIVGGWAMAAHGHQQTRVGRLQDKADVLVLQKLRKPKKPKRNKK